MPEYLAPGVFVEEVDSGSKPIEGVGVNTAAFIGYAKSGDFNKPTFITNWTQFCETFGEEENALTAALVSEMKMSIAEVRAAKKASRKGWMGFAQASVDRAIREKSSTLRGFQDFLRKYNIPTDGLPYRQGSYLAHSVYGFYNNGGGRCYVVRVAHPDDITALSGAGGGAASGSKSEPTPARIAAGPLMITAAKPGAAGNNVKVAVEHVGDNEVKLHITQGDTAEHFPDGKDKPLTLDQAIQNVNKFSKLVKLEQVQTATQARPEAKEYILAGGIESAETSNLPAKTGTTDLAKSALSNGLSNVRANDFVGDEAQRTGIGGLVPIEGVQMIAIPDLMAGAFQREAVPGSDGAIGPEVLALDDAKRQSILDIQCALVAHCERMGNRMAILDPIPGLNAQEMNEVTLNTAYNCDNGQAAIYYPWIKTTDPMNKGHQMFVPPSGHVAGVYARVGVERGVHKAPANEFIMGAVDLETKVTKGEQELLNPNGINCIRSFPGMGIKIWGARTLATVGNPSWKYVNVRRLFNYLKDSLDRGLQWVVFEPNDQDLWGRVRRTISAFLYTEWREGKLFGTTPAEAYYVKCDSETNPQEMIDLGRLYCEIGVNPVKPAEFVILRMGQWSSGSSVGEQ